MDARDRANMVRRFFSGTAPTYDSVVSLTTIGRDSAWKKRIVEKIPAGSATIVDQACGTGILTVMIARKFPAARVIGIDVTKGYLDRAREKVKNLGLRNVTLIEGRAEDIHPGLACDAVTSSYLAKYADLGRLVPLVKKMLRPGGRLVMHDFTYPPGPAFARLWRSYFTLLQTFGALLYPSWKPAFDELPGLLRETDWMSRLAALLKAEGFTGIEATSLTLGASAMVCAAAA